MGTVAFLFLARLPPPRGAGTFMSWGEPGGACSVQSVPGVSCSGGGGAGSGTCSCAWRARGVRLQGGACGQAVQLPARARVRTCVHARCLRFFAPQGSRGIRRCIDEFARREARVDPANPGIPASQRRPETQLSLKDPPKNKTPIFKNSPLPGGERGREREMFSFGKGRARGAPRAGQPVRTARHAHTRECDCDIYCV